MEMVSTKGRWVSRPWWEEGIGARVGRFSRPGMALTGRYFVPRQTLSVLPLGSRECETIVTQP